MTELDPYAGPAIWRIVLWLLAIPLAVVAGGFAFFLLLHPFSSYMACPDTDDDPSDPCFPTFTDEPVINMVTFFAVVAVGLAVLALARRVDRRLFGSRGNRLAERSDA